MSIRHLSKALVVLLLAAIYVGGTGKAPALADDDEKIYLPFIGERLSVNSRAEILIVGLVPDGIISNDMDEAVALQNVGATPANLHGWKIGDGEGLVILPQLWLAPGEITWCTRRATAFRNAWAFQPGCEYDGDSDASVPDADGVTPRLSNSGDSMQLQAPDGRIIDAIAYGNSSENAGWDGPSLQYYQRNARFAREGQSFYRLFDVGTGLPHADTDTATDWAQGNLDPAAGRRAAYCGWALRRFADAAHVEWTEPPDIQALVAPDNTFDAIAALFRSAEDTISIETYEFEHPELVEILVQRIDAGVDVQILLEGAPAGGLSNTTRWSASRIVAAGGNVRFMVNDVGDASDRYPYLHGKFAVVDGQTLLISTENFTFTSMPLDAADGDTLGRRGYAMIVQDPQLALAAQAIFDADFDSSQQDIYAFDVNHPKYGPPAPDYIPPVFADQTGYFVRHPQPLHAKDATEAFIFTSPESSLTPGPLLDLIDRTGAGDTILVQQLYEHPFWGPTDSSPDDDPNPRLEALIAAARRGADVRILLDSYFDDPSSRRSNRITANYVNEIAEREELSLHAKVGNPTGSGIHAKLFVLTVSDQYWVVVASMNGGEVSNKLNREMAIAIESRAVFEYYHDAFQGDWSPEP